MKYCNYCGRRLSIEAKFCGSCGRKQRDPIASHAPAQNTQGMSATDYEILARLENRNIEREADGLLALLMEGRKWLVEKYINDGYLETRSVPLLENITSYYTNAQIKAGLKAKGLKQSGVKEDIAQRLADALGDNEIDAWTKVKKVFALTPKGKEAVEKYKSDRVKKIEQTYSAAIKLCQNEQYDIAYKIIAKMNMEDPRINRTAMTDWSRHYETGLDRENIKTIRDFMNFQPPERIDNLQTMKVLSLIKSWSGRGDFDKYAHDNFGKDVEHNVFLDNLRYCLFIYGTLRDFQGYNDGDIDSYQILVALDDRTCEKCRRLHRKKFSLKGYKIGTTAPPFHIGCRCTTVAVIDGLDDF